MPPRSLNGLALSALNANQGGTFPLKFTSPSRHIGHGHGVAAADRGEHYFRIVIRESLSADERHVKYEQPLAEALTGIGRVAGGRRLAAECFDGRPADSVELDVFVSDRDDGLDLIRGTLAACGAGAWTRIEEYVPQYNTIWLTGRYPDSDG